MLQFVIFGLATITFAGDLQNFSITTNQTAEAKQKLEAFENGRISLEETAGTSWAESCQAIITFYLSHTNDVTVKMKLPVSRCFAALDKYPEAVSLAKDYLQVYSNDWRGWKILGAANFAIQNYDAAVRALTNSARLGDDGSYAPLALAALKTDRLDIVQGLVPHMLVLKWAKPTHEVVPLDIVMALTLYSLKADRQDIFVEALDGIHGNQIVSRNDLHQLVIANCKQFKGADIDKIRHEVESAPSSTNNVSSPPR